MQTRSRIQVVLVGIFAVVFLSACSHLRFTTDQTASQTPLETSADETSLALIAGDFVNAMRQIPSLEPRSTLVQLLRTQQEDRVVRAFENALDKTGYAVRWVGETSAKNLLQYRREDTRVKGRLDTVRFDIAVGDVELRRSYTDLLVESVKPATPLYVRGADATRVELDDSTFLHPDKSLSIEAAQLRVSKDISPLSGLLANSGGASALTVRTITAASSMNVFDLGESNYVNALSDHDIVVERVLTFPNDSLRIGSTNKRLLAALISRFNAETDLFSVIGCSLGPTKLKSGNAALALGRASRVREALLFAGVDQNKILDEGCWAGDSPSSTLPRRGVVVTLNRQSPET